MSALELSHVPVPTARAERTSSVPTLEGAVLNLSEEDGLNLVEAARTVQTSDCDTFVAVFERSARRRNDTVPMLLALAPNFSGGLWRDLKFDIRPKDSFVRIAIVDDQKPEKRGTRIFDRLFRAELQVFPFSKRKQAENWAQARGVNA